MNERNVFFILTSIFIMFFIVSVMPISAIFGQSILSSKSSASESVGETAQPVITITESSSREIQSATALTTTLNEKTASDDDNLQISTQTNVPTATTTKRSTDRSTATLTLTTTTQVSTEIDNKTPDNKSAWIYDEFHDEFIFELKKEADVPTELFGVKYFKSNNSMKLILNRTGNTENMSYWREQWALFATTYAQTVYDHKRANMSGNSPRKMRVIEFNASSKFRDITFSIMSESVWEYFDDEISWGKYNRRWFKKIRNTTRSEEKLADRIASKTVNGTFYPNETMTIHDQNESEDQSNDGTDSGEGTPTTTGTPTSNIQPPRVRPVGS